MLSSASVFGIIKLVDYGLYLNAFFWGTGLGFKFYAGNLKLTEKQFYEAETKQRNKLANNCENQLKQLLEKYPLNFKKL